MSGTRQEPFEDPAVTNFREYLRISSVHPEVNYSGCLAFLHRQASSLGLPIKVFYIVPKKPIVVLTWEGTEPSLPSILLNSHMDVVPVFKEKWTRDPFAAEKDENGNIFARGSQDMKCVGIQYMEAVRRLKAAGVKLRRTIHISFVPDEEIGGVDGMKAFVLTSDFKALNVGFALDEGIASPTEEYPLFYGERSIWQVHVHCPGTPGHASLLHSNTAAEKLRIIIDRFMDFRQKEKDKLAANPDLALGDVTTVNLTMIKGGVQVNVVPPELVVIFDIRLAITQDLKEFEGLMNSWCREAGEGINIEFEQKNKRNAITALDSSNPFWVAFKAECDLLKIKLKPAIFPAGTDSRYVRLAGIPALGFSPMNQTPVLLHDHDEFLNEKVFLRGIDIYQSLIPAVANV